MSRTYDNGQLQDIFWPNFTYCLAKSNLARQIYYTLSMENSLSLQKKSLQKKMNVWTVFGPYHKHSMSVHQMCVPQAQSIPAVL